MTTNFSHLTTNCSASIAQMNVTNTVYAFITASEDWVVNMTHFRSRSEEYSVVLFHRDDDR